MYVRNISVSQVFFDAQIIYCTYMNNINLPSPPTPTPTPTPAISFFFLKERKKIKEGKSVDSERKNVITRVLTFKLLIVSLRGNIYGLQTMNN